MADAHGRRAFKRAIKREAGKIMLVAEENRTQSFLLDLLLALVFGLIPMPVAIKWIGWFCCFQILVYLSGTWPLVLRIPKKMRLALWGVFSILFCIIFNSVALDEWKSEKANITKGILKPEGKHFWQGDKPDDDVAIRWGPGGTLIYLKGDAKKLTPGGSNLFIERKDGNLLLTTDVRDRDGKEIVEIHNNVWIVKGNSWDKNYTDNSLEVRDARSRVVLKVSLFDEYLQIEGEWWHEGATGVRIVRPYPYDPIKTGPMFVDLFRSGYMPDEPSIREMFKYPSSEYFGQKVDAKVYWVDNIFIFRVLGCLFHFRC